MNDLKTHRTWLDQVKEPVASPEIPIVDAHHHLWLNKGATGWAYDIDDFNHDTGSGHKVAKSVFVQCHAEYRQEGPQHLKPIGETEFVRQQAEQSSAANGVDIAGIVGAADMSLGSEVEEVLEAHLNAGGGRFKGVRYITAQDPHPPLSQPPSEPVLSKTFQAATAKLDKLDLTLDLMVYHPQLKDLVTGVQQLPNVRIVVNHLGCILGTGPYKDRRNEILDNWREQMSELASISNVFLKVGGIGMPMMGFRWDKRDTPASSAELVECWGDPIRWVIDEFGPDRCMFESNYPVDSRGASYKALWNAYKKISSIYSKEEQADLFSGTAHRAYKL